jgi:peptidoglycan glycosyltransferase
VNAPILRLFTLLLALFAALVGFTSYWSVFQVEELEGKSDNRRTLIEAQGVPRGTITTVDGTLLAESIGQGTGNQRVFTRSYPTGSLFGNPVGYAFVELGSTGIEQSENDVLTGRENEFATLIDELRGVAEEGSDLTVTLDAEAQRVATEGLAGRPGSVVALEPSTGAVRAMVSVPGFDPNQVPQTFNELSQDEAAPLLNRATQSPYPPGSTMKVVTAAAALDSGEFTPGTVLSGASPQEIGGVPLENAGGEQFGDIDMTTALTHSVNTYWAQVGEQLGNDVMFEYMDRFGFNQDPELDYPDDQMAASGVYEGGDLLGPGDAIDIGRVAIGQERLLVTALQMAQVAATVANDGVLMEPTFLQEVKDPDGRTTDELDPDEQTRAISDETAAQLTEMMTLVTEEGTAAGLTVQGVPFAGKTGTAEINLAGLNQPWFIGFAPADDPQVAVAATIERCQGCFGGEVAGPIATRVMETLLNR